MPTHINEAITAVEMELDKHSWATVKEAARNWAKASDLLAGFECTQNFGCAHCVIATFMTNAAREAK